MKKNPYRGKLVVFEGLDGSGNTTQAARLVQNLQEFGARTHLTKEPSQYLIGGLIKSWISHDWRSTPECLQLLFTADRAHHLDKEIIPLLKKGINVVCDRYFFSTVAYGMLDIKDEDWLLDLNDKFLLPDVTFLIKARPETCLRRIKSDRFGLELFEKKEKFKSVWKNYERLARRFRNMHIIDGEAPIQEVSKSVLKIAKKLFI